MISLLAEPAGPDTVVVRVGKALDFRNATDFKWLCQQQLAQGVKKFVLDFTDTGSLDSTGLGAIFSVYRQVNPRGGQVALASLSRPVQTVVRLSGSYKVFPQYASVTDATAA